MVNGVVGLGCPRSESLTGVLTRVAHAANAPSLRQNAQVSHLSTLTPLLAVPTPLLRRVSSVTAKFCMGMLAAMLTDQDAPLC